MGMVEYSGPEESGSKRSNQFIAKGFPMTRRLRRFHAADEASRGA